MTAVIVAQLSIWMPAIVATIGGFFAVIGVGWQILERRDSRKAADAAEADRKLAEEAARRAEREKQSAIAEHAAMVSAMAGQREHLQLFMEDNQRLRSIVAACEGDCDRIRAENRELLNEQASLRRENVHQAEQIDTLKRRLDELTGGST